MMQADQVILGGQVIKAILKLHRWFGLDDKLNQKYPQVEDRVQYCHQWHDAVCAKNDRFPLNVPYLIILREFKVSVDQNRVDPPFANPSSQARQFYKWFSQPNVIDALLTYTEKEYPHKLKGRLAQRSSTSNMTPEERESTRYSAIGFVQSVVGIDPELSYIDHKIYKNLLPMAIRPFTRTKLIKSEELPYRLVLWSEGEKPIMPFQWDHSSYMCRGMIKSLEGDMVQIVVDFREKILIMGINQEVTEIRIYNLSEIKKKQDMQLYKAYRSIEKKYQTMKN